MEVLTSANRSKLPLALNLEVVLWGSITLLAAMMRLYHLGFRPLAAEESLRALSAWQLVNGGMPAFWDEPLIILSTSFSFFLLGDNDFTARLIPSLIGVAMIWLVWMLRDHLGRGASLASAFLIAISPSFIYYSRVLGGSILVAFLSLLLVVIFLRYLKEGKTGYLGAIAIGLAMLLSAGPGAITVLIIFAAFLALLVTGEADKIPQSLKHNLSTIIRCGLIFLGLFFLLSTGFLTNLKLLGFPSLIRWVGQFDLAGKTDPWQYPLLALAAYEPLLLVLGGAGAVAAVVRWRRRGTEKTENLTLFLVFWSVIAFVLLILAGDKRQGQILLVLLPLTLLAGSLVPKILFVWRWDSLRRASPILGVACVLFFFSSLVISSLAQPGSEPPWFQWLLPTLCMALLLVLLVWLAAHSDRETRSIIYLALLVVATSVTVHTALSLNYHGSSVEWLPGSVASTDIGRMVTAAKSYTEMPFGDNNRRLIIQSSLKQHLEWYFRGRENVSFQEKISSAGEAIIASMELGTEQNLAGYVERKAELSSNWTLGVSDFPRFWRWLVYREPHGTVESRRISLFMKD